MSFETRDSHPDGRLVLGGLFEELGEVGLFFCCRSLSWNLHRCVTAESRFSRTASRFLALAVEPQPPFTSIYAFTELGIFLSFGIGANIDFSLCSPGGNNLVHERLKARMTQPTTLVFRVSLRARLYRDIEASSSSTLADLAEAIVMAFGFDMDHAYGFYSKLTGKLFDSPRRFELFADIEGSSSRSVKRTRVITAFPAGLENDLPVRLR